MDERFPPAAGIADGLTGWLAGCKHKDPFGPFAWTMYAKKLREANAGDLWKRELREWTLYADKRCHDCTTRRTDGDDQTEADADTFNRWSDDATALAEAAGVEFDDLICGACLDKWINKAMENAT